MKFLKDITIILASASPRRSDLLRQMGISFQVHPSNVSEDIADGLDIKNIPGMLAKRKALAVAEQGNPDALIIGADTIVVHEQEVLGKPTDLSEAKSMLKRLSGNTHQVITGVCLIYRDKTVVFNSTTDVTFQKLTASSIEYYVDHFRPLDKAGGYAIQEWIGAIGIGSIHGEYNNVVGLPTARLHDELMKLLDINPLP